MISKKKVPPSLTKYVKPYNGNVAGIGCGKLIGFFIIDLEIGAIWLSKVKIYIIENDIPILLGRDVIFDRADFKCLPDTNGLQMIEKVSSTVKSIVPYEYRGVFTARQRDDSLLKILKTEKSIDLEKINSIN
jgi:hypothetical protein